MAGAEPMTRLQLNFSVENLGSDIQERPDGRRVCRNGKRRICRESVKNVRATSFNKTMELDYYFERRQPIKFAVYDVDNSGALSDQDYIGEVSTTVGELVGVHRGRMTQSLILPAHPKKQRGSITVVAEEVKSSNGLVCMEITGQHLDKKDFFGKSDPFFKILRESPGGWIQAHKSEVIKKTLDPKWRPLELRDTVLCNGEYDRPLRFEVYDWDANTSHDLIGVFETTLRALADAPGGRSEHEVINPKKTSKSKYKNSGVLTIACTIEPQPTFIEYVQGGYEINFSIAIDFTGSNGDPRMPSSLHFMNPMQPNQYIQAIDAVGRIVQDYDSDKYFPALGYGAKLADGSVSHCFSLTGDAANPYCPGIAGVIAAYQQMISTVQLWGPTNFAPIIHHVSTLARQNPHAYYVLLMLTDGIITDMEATKRAIVEASSLPLSIIIVGVGNSDFDAMEELDGDDGRLAAGGRFAERDIVQFVPFRAFSGPQTQASLAAAVLAEVPAQFLSYMKKNKINPPPPLKPVRG